MDVLQSYAHMIFDANCYFDYILWQVKLHQRQPNVSAVLSPYFSRDVSVFLYETFALTKQSSTIPLGDETLREFYKNLAVMRNSVHQLVTRDKDFVDESGRIANSTGLLQSVFKTNTGGLISLFAKDIGLTKARISENDLWISSTLFPWFLLDRTSLVDHNGLVRSKIIKHNALISSTIKSIVEKLNLETADAFKVSLQLPLLTFDEKAIFHEDIKLSQLEKQTGFPLELTYTLLLIADEIGAFLFLINYIIDKHSAFVDNNTLFFLTRMISIRYDEVFDTLWKFRNRADYKSNITERFDAELQKRNIIPQEKALRTFARNLRNSIHYENTPWCPSVNGSTVDYVPAFLQIVAGGEWPNTYLDSFVSMEEQLERLYSYLMDFFNITGSLVDM